MYPVVCTCIFGTFLQKVLCVGPTGTGKTLTAVDKLIRGMPEKYMSDFLTFSARTSANQTQDIIDAKLDKRCVQEHSKQAHV